MASLEIRWFTYCFEQNAVAMAGISRLTYSRIRFIPDRNGQDLQANFSLLPDEVSPTTPSKSKRRPTNGELHFQKSKDRIALVGQIQGLTNL